MLCDCSLCSCLLPCLCVSLCVCVCVCVLLCLSLCLSVSLSLCLSVSLSVCLSLCLSVCLCIARGEDAELFFFVAGSRSGRADQRGREQRAESREQREGESKAECRDHISYLRARCVQAQEQLGGRIKQKTPSMSAEQEHVEEGRAAAAGAGSKVKVKVKAGGAPKSLSATALEKECGIFRNRLETLAANSCSFKSILEQCRDKEACEATVEAALPLRKQYVQDEVREVLVRQARLEGHQLSKAEVQEVVSAIWDQKDKLLNRKRVQKYDSERGSRKKNKVEREDAPSGEELKRVRSKDEATGNEKQAQKERIGHEATGGDEQEAWAKQERPRERVKEEKERHEPKVEQEMASEPSQPQAKKVAKEAHYDFSKRVAILQTEEGAVETKDFSPEKPEMKGKSPVRATFSITGGLKVEARVKAIYWAVVSGESTAHSAPLFRTTDAEKKKEQKKVADALNKEAKRRRGEQGEEQPKEEPQQPAQEGGPAKEEPQVRAQEGGQQPKEEPQEPSQEGGPAKEEPQLRAQEGGQQANEEPQEPAQEGRPAKEEPQVRAEAQEGGQRAQEEPQAGGQEKPAQEPEGVPLSHEKRRELAAPFQWHVKLETGPWISTQGAYETRTSTTGKVSHTFIVRACPREGGKSESKTSAFKVEENTEACFLQKIKEASEDCWKNLLEHEKQKQKHAKEEK